MGKAIFNRKWFLEYDWVTEKVEEKLEKKIDLLRKC